MWFYFRLYCLPMIISVCFYLTYPEDRDQFDIFITINVVFLSTLLALHTIWFLMFQRINYQHFVSGKKVKADDMVIKGSEEGEELPETPSTCGSSSSEVSPASFK